MGLFGINLNFGNNGKKNPIVRQRECHQGQDAIKEAFNQRFNDFDKALDRRFKDFKDFLIQNGKRSQ